MRYQDLDKYIPYYLTEDRKKELIPLLKSFSDKNLINKKLYSKSCLEDNIFAQGDIIDNVQLFNHEDGRKKLAKAVILSNTCDIALDNDRTRDAFPPLVNVAPIIPFDKFEDLVRKTVTKPEDAKNKLSDIKDQKPTNILYYPPNNAYINGGIVLLNNVHSFHVNKLKDDGCNVVCRLSDIGFYLFIFKLSIHFCRMHEGLVR